MIVTHMVRNETMAFHNSVEVIEHVSVNPLSGDSMEMIEYYKYFTQIVGLLIIVINLSVVVTSGLILKKAVQPKSTYLLLGNISLADTILGVTMLFSSFSDKAIVEVSELQDDSLHTVCMVLQGLRMCPSVVSILSVGFIAADRYIYLLHGLYYKTWVSARRVRIAIVCIWILGTIFTIPGWMNISKFSRCYFMDIFPVEQMLTMAAMSFTVVVGVTMLYCIILIKAVKANNKIQKAKKIAQISIIKDKTNSTSSNESTQSIENYINLQHKIIINDERLNVLEVKSLESINRPSIDGNQNFVDMDPKGHKSELPHNGVILLMVDEYNLADSKINNAQNNSSLNRSVSSITDVNKVQSKHKENKKCRAITVVILTTGSFIITWVPFITSMSYYGSICERIYTKDYCEQACQRLLRPMWSLALFNSLLNPFIYAWWHHGFKEYIRSCYKKCFRKVV